MEGAEKGSSSTANVKKKNSDLDDVIGKDFLTSWKDEMEFSTETPPRGKKTNFSFDKDDDFELGGDFGNFLSFKLDLSELNFSSPGRKTEPPMEKSVKEAAQPKAKKDSFAYNFDFPELESFGLDSNLLKGDKKVNVDNKTSNICGKVNKNPEDEIHMNTTIETKEKRPQNSTQIERTNSLMSDHMVEHKSTDIRSYNSSVTVPDCTEMFAEDKHKSGMNVNMNKGSKDQEEMMEAHPHTEKSALASQVQSGNKLAAKTLSESQTERQSFTTFNPKFDIELANFEGHPTSPASRRSSSGNGIDLKRTNSMSESSDVDSKLQQNLDKKTEITEESTSEHQSDQATKDVGARGLSSKAQAGLKSTHHSFRSKLSNPKAFLLSGQKEPIKKSECQQGGFLKSYNGEVTKQSLSVVGNDRSKKDGPTPGGELVGNVENAFHEGGHPRSYDGEAKQQKLPVRGHDGTKNVDLDSNILRISTKYSRSCSPIPKNTGLAQFELMKISSTQRPALSTVNNDCELKKSEDNASINRIKELNSSLRKVDCQNDSKLVDIHSTSSKVATNESTNKSALFSPMLKRKASEGSPADPFALRVLKRFSESPSGIRNLEVTSPKICGRLALATENTLDCPGDISIEPQATSDLSSDSNLMDIDVSLVMGDDGNVEKAEACAKELDDICNMLKKKHEEAKELLARAVVNNNYLLMLNHPMYEDKIRTLHSRANSLLSKYQEL